MLYDIILYSILLYTLEGQRHAQVARLRLRELLQRAQAPAVEARIHYIYIYIYTYIHTYNTFSIPIIN